MNKTKLLSVKISIMKLETPSEISELQIFAIIHSNFHIEKALRGFGVLGFWGFGEARAGR